MFPDYQLLVLRYYEKKRSDNGLPLGLGQPTTAKLKAECLVKSAKGFSLKDKKILVGFFGESGDDGAILKKIKNCEPDIFKPLLNYLKKKTNNTDPKNIELLAWLIDFEPRPYEFGKSYDLKVLERDGITPEVFEDIEEEKKKEELIEEKKKEEVDVIKTPPNELNSDVPKKTIEQKDSVEGKGLLVIPPLAVIKRNINTKAMVAALFIVIAVAASIIYLKNDGGGCMYWAGDRYQQVPCNQKMGSDTVVIALDMERLNSFKKITREDTITSNDIGKVWYVKIDGRPAFFTADGYYPLDHKLRLKPLTDYIINKYIDTARADTSH